jgi:hypothetical protein
MKEHTDYIIDAIEGIHSTSGGGLILNQGGFRYK